MPSQQSTSRLLSTIADNIWIDQWPGTNESIINYVPAFMNGYDYCHCPSADAKGKLKNPSPSISPNVNKFSGSKPIPTGRDISGMKNWFAAVLAGGIVDAVGVAAVGSGYTVCVPVDVGF